MKIRLIGVQHRLADRTGHRFHQSMAYLESARRRGWGSVLFLHREAEPEVRAAFPQGHAVLSDPVFRRDLSFDERTALFADMLGTHVSPVIRAGDRLLMTIATQCEARAIFRWSAELPARKRPWSLVLFPSDRWNREGAEERNRLLGEIAATALEIARIDAGVRRRIVLASHTASASAELAVLLGEDVGVAPMAELVAGIAPRAGRRLEGPVRVGVFGGARPEKGSHRLAEIVAACRRRGAIDFNLQLANEQLTEDQFAQLCRLADEPGIDCTRGGLGRDDYVSLFARTDLALFPYQRIPYRQRASGILSESILAGLPVVVPSGTWLAEQVASGAAAGVIYEEDDVESIAAAVWRAADDLARLSARARERVETWRESQTMDPFLDWLEGVIAVRSAAEAAVSPPRGGLFRAGRSRFWPWRRAPDR